MNQPSIYKQVMEKILALKGHFLSAFFRDVLTLMKVINQIPYVKVEGQMMTSRPGTVTQAVSNVTLNDGAKGFVLMTGGNLSKEELQKVTSLLNEFGEGQMFAVPGQNPSLN